MNIDKCPTCNQRHSGDACPVERTPDSFGRPTVPCGLCGKPTAMTGTKRCDACHELESRIQGNPDLARRILAGLAPVPAENPDILDIIAGSLPTSRAHALRLVQEVARANFAPPSGEAVLQRKEYASYDPSDAGMRVYDNGRVDGWNEAVDALAKANPAAGAEPVYVVRDSEGRIVDAHDSQPDMGAYRGCALYVYPATSKRDAEDAPAMRATLHETPYSRELAKERAKEKDDK